MSVGTFYRFILMVYLHQKDTYKIVFAPQEPKVPITMLHNITWQQFWVTIAAACVVYYLWVYVAFFKSFRIGSRKRLVPAIVKEDALSSDSPGAVQNRDALPAALNAEELSFLPPSQFNDAGEYTAWACMDELIAFLEQFKSGKIERKNMIASLQQIVNKYPSIRGSELEETITKTLSAQCLDICAIHLSKEEIAEVWM